MSAETGLAGQCSDPPVLGIDNILTTYLSDKVVVINLERRFHMRFNEFADPRPYTLSADDATDFVERLERIWPHEDVAFVLGIKRQPQARGMKDQDRR